MTDDVQAAVDIWLGRDGTEADRNALLARLASDPPFRRAVAAELHLVGMLQTVRAGEPRWLRLENELGRTDAGAGDLERIEAAVMSRVRAEPRRTFRSWGVGFAAAAGLAAAVGLMLYPSNPQAKQTPADSSYWGVVAQSWPWAGWRFDRMANGSVPNVVPGRPALTVLGGVTAGPDGSAVFRPNDPAQALVADATWTPPRATGYAVELWFRAAGFQKSTLAGMVDDGSTGKEVHALLAELGDETQELYRAPFKVRGLDRWPPGEHYGANLFSPRAYQPDRWHHLVLQRAGDQWQLVFDGETVEAVVGPSPDTGPLRLVLGRQRSGAPRALDNRPFVGRLADVALYDHPLSSDDIQAHHAAGSRRNTE